jgi:hypothetical protein
MEKADKELREKVLPPIIIQSIVNKGVLETKVRFNSIEPKLGSF